MFNFTLEDNEKILLIDDNVMIDDNYYTGIITTKRFLIMAYPSNLYNSNEDLRASGKLNYIKMLEPILDKYLNEIKEIVFDNKYDKVIFTDDTYIEIKTKEIIKKLNEIINKL